MVSFKPTDEEAAFVKMAKDFALHEIRPAARESEENKKVDHAIIKKANELGFTLLELPESWGGLELPLISQVQITEALAMGDLGVVQGLGGAGDAASFIRMDPDNSLLADYKISLASGTETAAAFLNCEEDGKHKVTIEASGGEYLLNGRSAPVKMAEKAECLLISGVDSAGEDVLLWIGHIQQHSGLRKKTGGDYRLGLLSSHFASYEFENVKLNQASVFAMGEAARSLKDNAISRIIVLEAAKEVGLMNAALSYTAEYTSQRKAFGQEIAKFQGVSFNVAQMAIAASAARNLVWHAAMKIDQQEADAIGFSMGTLNNAHEAVRFVTDSAVQLLGGHGYVQEHPVEKWMRDAQAQVNVFMSESELLARSGDYLLSGTKGGIQDDILRTVTASKPS
ncbi:acyl-CoA dehydrogenase family protein [Peribacillus glennii]|uniref:Acyl-CoA dehydrogenase n=1 Tax=Peribacillus glennii TaxID=2303991 RepID=A0A372LER8_9BACI|nr:acyl-CoA dehydrogenase family protein [Peribacillus glennii]RFU64801.1 acyl-CoA dehydrogenase [Peribacillus glennii]